MKKSHFSTIHLSKWKKIRLPKGWNYDRLGNIVKLANGEFLPHSRQIKGKFPIYGGNGLIGKHNDFVSTFPTIVIGRVGVYCGTVYQSNGKSWVTDNAIHAKTIDKKIDKEYLYYYLSRLNINALAEISAQPKITQAILDNLIILFSKNINEQKKIAKILLHFDNTIKIHEKILGVETNPIEKTKIKDLQMLRRGLMEKLLTGKIRVS